MIENAERKNRFTALLITAFIAVGCLIAFPLLFSGCSNGVAPSENPVPQQPEQPIDLNILCVGDVMVHRSQLASQYDSSTKKYDYTNNYRYVKDYISQADLALCNVETTFAGAPYSGYPDFCAPDELADALKDAGFDVAITSNNHMMDRGGYGLKRTVEVLRNKGFLTAGSRLDPQEKRYAMIEVKGVKVAVVPYTYETPVSGTGTGINGRVISSENAELINSFSYQTLDQDLEQIKRTCDEARTDGAEIVILYYHWGEEYQTSANRWQRYIAQQSADHMNVDMIFASHPHVLQEMEYLKSQKDGKEIPVFFSMGNFISNQRIETLDNRYTEEGILAKVHLKYLKSQGKITDIKMSAIPTWVEKYTTGSKPIYEIIPLDDNLQKNETLKASGHLSRAEAALEDANGLLKKD
ncbi:CapA family protein [Aminipila luticellarii]|uniref:CapA family protein n=1 Tax=Aminipila luticellarii TaxID=2507160 RepID=A0A410PXQ7_9FIRM|nr:CapA family protein [Aminipila luticellarii]QAT43674.1 CapA family protein [Aminipila luticellarii]